MNFDFASPGATAYDSIIQALAARQAQERQARLDALQEENIRSLMKDRDEDRKVQMARYKQEGIEKDAAQKEQRADRLTRELQPLQSISKSTAGVLKGTDRGDLVQTNPDLAFPGFLQPNVDMNPGEQPGDVYKGTSAQQHQLAQEEQAGENMRAANARAAESAKPSIVREYEYYVNEMTKAGQKPKSFEEYQTEDANRKASANSGGTPYFTPLQTDEGYRAFDNRSGKVGDVVAGFRPGEAAQKAITDAQSILYTIGEIEQEFKPERVGPLKGRYNTMQLALVGELGDEGLANLQSDVARLKNTVINLRTGAQMSEPEAQRILKEVPDFNLPPDVFMSRLSNAKNYFKNWMRDRVKNATGRGNLKALEGDEKKPEAAPAGVRRYDPATGDLK